jgi:serine/threonine-protein kinase RsbW/sigma-B regulation protein RsbU (phosphoserine phosphatase)
MTVGAASMQLHVSPDDQGIARAAGAFLAFAARGRVPADVRADMYVALEEMVSNVVHHGSPSGPVQIQLAIAGGMLRVDIVDDGAAFDPVSAPQPDLAAPLEERPVGGLGVPIALGLVECRYTRADGRNHLTMTRRLA